MKRVRKSLLDLLRKFEQDPVAHMPTLAASGLEHVMVRTTPERGTHGPEEGRG